MRRKVCILTSVHPPFDVRVFWKECRTLARAGFAVTLVAPHSRREVVEGIEIVPLPRVKSRIYRMLGSSIRTLLLAKQQAADVYHIHDPELLLVGVALKILSGRAVVYDIHEDYAKQMLSKPYLPRMIRGAVAALVRAVERLAIRFFDSIVAAREDICRNFSPHARCVQVRNFPVVSDFACLRRKKQDDVFSLVYVGGLTRIRGITEVVRALGAVARPGEVKLILGGEFSPPAYAREVQALEGFRRVEYRRWLNPEQVPRVLGEADAGVVCLHPVPNYLTGLSTKLFEYMAAGLPVIASDFPLWKGFVEGNDCGVCVNPLDTEEIARAIEYLMDHPDRRRKMGENGRNVVLEKYSWERESAHLLQIYDEMLGG